MIGDHPCHQRRAVHRGQHADIIARADLAVGAQSSRRRLEYPRAPGTARSTAACRSHVRPSTLRNPCCGDGHANRLRSDAVAKPIGWPRRWIISPFPSGRSATLWPNGISPAACRSNGASAWPATMSRSAIATSSPGLSCSTAFFTSAIHELRSVAIKHSFARLSAINKHNFWPLADARCRDASTRVSGSLIVSNACCAATSAGICRLYPWP